MSERKPRFDLVGLRFDEPITIASIRQNSDGSLTFLDAAGLPLDMGSSVGGLAYARAKGPKITVQVPEAGDRSAGPLAALSRFDSIVGVDTNSHWVGPERVCITVVCRLDAPDLAANPWTARVEPLWGLEFRDPTADAERVGWRHALATGPTFGLFRHDRATLMTVDAHLGQLADINERRRPIVDDYYLPQHVSLAYASSDKPQDSPLNGLMARCDKLASAILQQSIARGPAGLLQSPGTPFRAHRYWRFS
ncbi:MAG: hypothetical protein ABL971_05235 [Vicinamibacterales bacterium]